MAVELRYEDWRCAVAGLTASRMTGGPSAGCGSAWTRWWTSTTGRVVAIGIAVATVVHSGLGAAERSIGASDGRKTR